MLRAVIYLLVFLCLGLGLGAVALGQFFLQDRPALEASAPPSSQDVAAARTFVRDVRRVAGDGATQGDDLWASAAQLNSLVRLGGRFISGFRGRVTVTADAVEGDVAVPVPWWSGQKWLNLSGTVPPFEGTFRLSHLTVGGRGISPDLAVSVARIGANLAAGDRFGDKVLQSANAMAIDGDTVRFNISLDSVGRNGVMRGAFGMLRGSEMPSAEQVEAFHSLIRAAMARGDLPQTGSFLPYLAFTLSEAYAQSTADTLPNVYTAAIFGLAKACGARDFSMIVGRLAFDASDGDQNWPVSCEEITFNGRIDSRRHFITSAALQAASNRGVSISLGEFKELYDTISGAGGFDFTDMAANLSGVRLSNVLMTLPRAEWPDRLDLLETENDVIVPFDGIPQLMPEAAFKARYRDVESPAYTAMLAQIEARIDALRFYQGP